MTATVAHLQLQLSHTCNCNCRTLAIALLHTCNWTVSQLRPQLLYTCYCKRSTLAHATFTTCDVNCHKWWQLLSHTCDCNRHTNCECKWYLDLHIGLPVQLLHCQNKTWWTHPGCLELNPKKSQSITLSLYSYSCQSDIRKSQIRLSTVVSNVHWTTTLLH